MKKYIVREIYKKRIDRYIGKEIIKVLVGQRRVGKSYLLFQAMDSIKEQFPLGYATGIVNLRIFFN